MKRPIVSIAVPVVITIFVPYLSSNLPIIGALTPKAKTSGITIKLALDVDNESAVTASEGRKIMAV